MQLDSLSLGIVKSVSKFNVDVCLPHGEIGRVNIYDVSDKYSELLKEMVASGQMNNDVASLEDMFVVGQSVRCFIKKRASSLSDDRQHISGSKHLAEVSLNPKLVNKDVSKKYLRMHTIFTGAIQTEEDHGYIIDSGINGVQCFLPHEGLRKKFPLGSLVLVRPYVADTLNFVASGVSRILKVTTDFGGPSDVVLSDSIPVHFGSLLPGLWVRAVVFKRISSTIIAKFADHLVTISRAHYNGNEEDYPLNMEVIVCLIVVDPGSKQIIGSLLPHLLPTAASTENQPTLTIAASIGTRLSGCPIERVDKRTLHLTVPGSSFRVVVRKGHVPAKLADDNLKSKFTVGQKVTCRVIDHDLLENVAIATMKKKLLQLPFLSIDELSPGDKLTAIVNRFTKTGIVVRVEDRLNGLIPYLHLADVPLKRPAEKFTRGEKISCRVLSLDHSANKLLLTAKRGLVESACPLFGSKDMYDWLESHGAKETLFAAFVVKVSERGLLLAGLQDLRAWLPRRETGLGPDDVLEATYFRGQVLRVRILHRLDRSRSTDCHNENENAARSQFLVSLKLKSTSEPSGRSQKPKFTSVQIGQVFLARVTKVQQTGLIVDLHSTESTDSTPSPTVGSAFLGFDQLSDSETNQVLFARYMHNVKSGSWLDFDHTPRSVVVINKAANTLIVSARPTLVQSAKVRQQKQPTADSEPVDSNRVDEHVGFVCDFSDLRVGSQWFGWVLNHVDYGIFVQFPVGVRGLAPTRLLSDNMAPKHVNWMELFPSGATVIAKVVELAPSEKRRCLVSLRMMDTYFAEEHYVDLAIRSLNTWLTELDWIARKNGSCSGFQIGDQVEFRVNSVDTTLAVGEAAKARFNSDTVKNVSWTTAIAYLCNAEGVQCTPDTKYGGIVCFVDHMESRLEVALSTWLLNAVKNRKENAASALKPGQKISSVTMALRPRDMAVVALRGHAAGCFGIVPARRTFNDVVGGNAWALGQRNRVTVRQAFERGGALSVLHLCTLSIHDPIVATAALPGQVESIMSISSNVSSQPGNNGLSFDLVPGARISGLRLNRVVGKIAFFQLPNSTTQNVFCHLINVAQTAKEVRAFQLRPPPSGTVMQATATVLRSAAENKRNTSRSQSVLHSHLAEISFLAKPHVEVGDLVCAQLIRVHQDSWFVHLPGGDRAHLHVTGMLHSKLPKPITLKVGDQGVVHHSKDLGTGLKINRFITCRIIDRVDNLCTEDDPRRTSSFFYVSTKPEVVRGGVEFWKKRKPVFGVPTDGFIKIRCPAGLLVSLTHTEDMLVPFSPELQQRIRTAELRFRVGDHLCVRPLRMIDDRLVGELVLTDDGRTEQDIPSSDVLIEATSELLKCVTERLLKKQKYLELKRTRTQGRELKFVDPCSDTCDAVVGTKRPKDSTEVSSPPPKRKKLRDTTALSKSVASDPLSSSVDGMLKQLREQCEVTATTDISPSEEKITCDKDGESGLSTAIDATSWDIADPELISRYAKFMLPANFESTDEIMEQDSVLNAQNNDDAADSVAVDTSKASLATSEWKLRETELRNAMLAALTSEQHCLPKGYLRPTTTEEFELAVRNAPASAACWTAYMTHVLSSGRCGRRDLVEARAIAERGLRAITTSGGLDCTEQDAQHARLLSFLLVMEAKELERCNQRQNQLSTVCGSDPVLEMGEQADRLSNVLTRLVNLNQAPFIRRAIDTLTDIGQFDRAEELARKLIKSNPGDMDRWLSLIKVRFRAGRLAAAREAQRNGACILRAVHLPRFLISSARLEFEFGDADRAISLFREQLLAHPKQRVIYEEFIKLLLLAGKSNEAKQLLEKAKESLKSHDCERLRALFTKQTALKTSS